MRGRHRPRQARLQRNDPVRARVTWRSPPTAPGQRPVSGTITYACGDGSTLTALETSIGNVNPDTGSGHAGGTQQFTDGTGHYEGATGFTYLAQHFEDDHFVTQIQGEVCSWDN